jgi:hypothetical protein
VVVVIGGQHAVLERHAVEYVGDDVVAVEPPPALLGCREQLVGHRERCGLRSGTFVTRVHSRTVSERAAESRATSACLGGR